MVAVVGLGNMGLAMLRRLVAAGRTPRAWDLEEERRAAAAAAGAAVPGGLGGAVGPEVILSLPDAGAVGTVLSAILPVLSKGSVIIDTSTLAPAEARGFAATAEGWGCAYLDAPVSGGPAGAAAGTLAMMIGGDGAALARARPVIDLLAAKVLHIGPSGAGQVAKLVNNLLVATNLVVSAEALRLGAAAGVAPEALLPVINGATGRSAATEVNWPRWILSETFDSGFSAGLMRKDVRLALGLAASVGAPLDATARAAAAWEALRDAVPDEADFNRLAAAVFAPPEA
ncbi:NAD(P)-dependent oxidoreductase [Roseomonas sp. PWR1]|uniref:NAD(P)-dependent oxidoreductase n=1 Tax=Roseomonas nitratireducens TaxID=2820810 RepID=A0ABS4APF8_9PROT|nr:NAD(P)-dependent oxidoreductase [Neoroseomonas nitratireducens]MBP0463239.1 NAD(P)-dependent oxidoreductase [Neoroseomonas nitratireducens]